MLTGKDNAEKIWNYLKGLGMTDYGAAGMMGNIYAESGLEPGNLQNSANKRLGMTDEEYTLAVDNGLYTNFVRDSAGYGLCQWTYWSRKEGLLNLAKSMKVSVADLAMQLNYLSQEIQKNYPSVYEKLCSASSVREASDIVLTRFEQPADQSVSMQERRAAYGQTYYDRFSAKTVTALGVTETSLRKKVADIMRGWLGGVRGGPQHKEILALYNAYKPLARGYTVKQNDAYCATTVSAAYIKAGIAGYTGTECGANEYINIAKKKGLWVENDAYIAGVGDAVEYDWQDGGSGDNQGYTDHIGIIIEVRSGSFLVAEGNINGGKIGTRELAFNGRYIRGFICPPYAQIAKDMGGTAEEPEYPRWVCDGKHWYYRTAEGQNAHGWKEINDRWYFFGEDGAMYTGLHTIESEAHGKEVYYFQESGDLEGAMCRTNDRGALVP